VQFDPVVVDAPEAAGQQGGEHEADGHRLAVAQRERLVPEGRRLESVGEGVTVVEDHAPVALMLVGCDHLGLDRRATRHLLVEVEERSEASGSPGPKKAYFAISPRPHAHSRAGRLVSVSVSQSTARGCQNEPTRFFPSGG